MTGPEAAGTTVPTKVCPHCGVQSQTAADKCPNCGKKYRQRSRGGGCLRALLFGVVGIIVLIIIIVVATSGGDTGGSGGSGGTSGKVGQAVTNAGTTYKVTNVQTTKKIGDPSLGGARADGTFVVVSLQLTNNKSETKTFTDSTAKMKTSDGKEYSTSDKAVLAFGDKSLLLKEIQPDLTTRGKLAFELPPSKVSGSKLVIEDLFGSGEVDIDLGL